MNDRIEITHPIDTAANAAGIMFALLHSFAELAGKYPTAKIDDEIARQAMRALLSLPGATNVQPPDPPASTGIFSPFNACMYREQCRPAATELRHALEVIDAVKEQFDRFGHRFSDGFDARVFQWVNDAAAQSRAILDELTHS